MGRVPSCGPSTTGCYSRTRATAKCPTTSEITPHYRPMERDGEQKTEDTTQLPQQTSCHRRLVQTPSGGPNPSTGDLFQNSSTGIASAIGTVKPEMSCHRCIIGLSRRATDRSTTPLKCRLSQQTAAMKNPGRNPVQ